jgi:hypothetical protein
MPRRLVDLRANITSFGNCVDGFIVVDLRTAEPKLLCRYLGDAGYESNSRVPGQTPILSPRQRL